MFLFKPKKPEEPKKEEVSKANIDLGIIMKMNQEFAVSLDLNDTLNTEYLIVVLLRCLQTSIQPALRNLSHRCSVSYTHLTLPTTPYV